MRYAGNLRGRMRHEAKLQPIKMPQNHALCGQPCGAACDMRQSCTGQCRRPPGRGPSVIGADADGVPRRASGHRPQWHCRGRGRRLRDGEEGPCCGSRRGRRCPWCGGWAASGRCRGRGRGVRGGRRAGGRVLGCRRAPPVAVLVGLLLAARGGLGGGRGAWRCRRVRRRCAPGGGALLRGPAGAGGWLRGGGGPRDGKHPVGPGEIHLPGCFLRGEREVQGG